MKTAQPGDVFRAWPAVHVAESAVVSGQLCRDSPPRRPGDMSQAGKSSQGRPVNSIAEASMIGPILRCWITIRKKDQHRQARLSSNYKTQSRSPAKSDLFSLLIRTHLPTLALTNNTPAFKPVKPQTWSPSAPLSPEPLSSRLLSWQPFHCRWPWLAHDECCGPDVACPEHHCRQRALDCHWPGPLPGMTGLPPSSLLRTGSGS